MKINFNFLKPKKYLIYDEENSKFFKSYLDPKDTEILHCRKEQFNFWILVKCIFFLKLNYKNYIFFYIQKINPKSIFTLIDNGTLFYQIKSKVNCKTYAVQNGLRTEFEDFFSKEFHKPTNLSCDKIFVWNTKVGEKFAEYINCEYVPIGSFKNNISEKIKTTKEDLLYISTYRKTNLDKKIYKNLTWGEFIKNEVILISHLKNYCINNNLKLSVLGRYDEARGEKKYFEEKFGKDFSFNYIRNYPTRPTYSIASNSNLIITIDSTLGYEMLATGKKVALFGIRPEIYPLSTRNYLWPNYQKGKGKYWLNTETVTFDDFSNLVNNLRDMKEEEWNEELVNIRKKIINYDPGNKIFLKETNLN